MPTPFFTTAAVQELLDKYAAEGYKPFDAAAYKAKYLTDPNTPLASNPLEHFLKIGAALGYNPLGNAPYLLFDAKFYAEHYPELAKSGVTDAGDLFGHALKFGIAEGREFTPILKNFDTASYLKAYPAVAAYVNGHLNDFLGSASNGAIAHFEKFGWSQGFKGTTLDTPTDDSYNLDQLVSVKSILTLEDNKIKDDVDTLEVTDTAVNFNSVGADTINLENLSNTFNFDFDKFDLTKVTKSGLTVLADANNTRDNATTNITASADNVVLGNLSLISQLGGFKSLHLTDASIASSGTSYTLDTINGDFLKGANTLLFSTDANGLVGASGINASLVTQGVTLKTLGSTGTYLVGSAQNDTITGGSGADALEGGKGADKLNGGPSTSETYTYKLSGALGVIADAKYSITIDGNTQVLTEKANPNPNNPNEVVNGASADVVGLALAKLINAHLLNLPGEFNASVIDGVVQGATYNDATDELVIKYAPGINVLPNNLKIEQSTPDGVNKTQLSSPPVIVNGSSGGGDDTFIFHAGDSTLVKTTADIIENFGSGSDTILFFNSNGSTVVGKDAGNGINYDESGFKTANFESAILAANIALTQLNNNPNASTGSLVSFQFDDTNGYLFQDVDGDGKVDQVVILTGINNTEISHADLA